MGDIIVPNELGTLTVNTIFVWLSFIFSLTAAVLVVRKRVKPLLNQLRNFLSDWSGEPERPGVGRKPGVMERLANVEKEMKPNGGTSIYDKVEKLTKASATHGEQLDDLTRSMSLLLTYFGSQDHTLSELIRKQNEIGLR